MKFRRKLLRTLRSLLQSISRIFMASSSYPMVARKPAEFVALTSSDPAIPTIRWSQNLLDRRLTREYTLSQLIHCKSDEGQNHEYIVMAFTSGDNEFWVMTDRAVEEGRKPSRARSRVASASSLSLLSRSCTPSGSTQDVAAPDSAASNAAAPAGAVVDGATHSAPTSPTRAQSSVPLGSFAGSIGLTPAFDAVHVVEDGTETNMWACLDRDYGYTKVSRLVFSADRVMKAAEIAVLLRTISTNWPYYDIDEYQCYWYADVVFQTVKSVTGAAEDIMVPKDARGKRVISDKFGLRVTVRNKKTPPSQVLAVYTKAWSDEKTRLDEIDRQADEERRKAEDAIARAEDESARAEAERRAKEDAVARAHGESARAEEEKKLKEEEKKKREAAEERAAAAEKMLADLLAGIQVKPSKASGSS